MPSTHPTRRAAVFAFADQRGNNPHGTRETSEHEGRRLNAGRYETVAAMDRALDRRARLLAPQLAAAPDAAAPDAQRSEPSNIWGALLLVAVGAAIAYVATRPSGADEDDEDMPRENPAMPMTVVGVAPVAAPVVAPVVAPVAAPVATSGTNP